jgi:hypothetical protein
METDGICWLSQKKRTAAVQVISTSGKQAFGQALLVPAIIWAGTKGLATSPQIRPPAREPLVPVCYKPLVPVWDTNRDKKAIRWEARMCTPFSPGLCLKLGLKASAYCGDPQDLSYTEMLCVLVTLATSDTGVTSPRPEHHRQAGRN